MRKLILIRHSESDPLPALPPVQWTLSPAGRRRCRPLAARLREHDPAVVLSSSERKAIETAQLVGSLLERPYEQVIGLGEHDRSGEPYHDRETFLQLVEALLTCPEEEVFGQETGAEALARFETAVATIVETYAIGNIAAVTHGTVLSLFVAARSGEDAYPFWEKLAQPGYVVFALPNMRLLEVVFDAGESQREEP